MWVCMCGITTPTAASLRPLTMTDFHSFFEVSLVALHLRLRALQNVTLRYTGAVCVSASHCCQISWSAPETVKSRAAGPLMTMREYRY